MSLFPQIILNIKYQTYFESCSGNGPNKFKMAELLVDHLKRGQVKDKQSGQDLTRIPPYSLFTCVVVAFVLLAHLTYQYDNYPNKKAQ